jgi:hypothetical protein
MRDQGTMAKIISNEQFDREVERAAETFEAESDFFQTRDPNTLNSKNQTIQYAMGDDDESVVGRVMSMEGYESVSDSDESRPPDPSSSSGGPPPPPPPSTGARVLNAMAATARGAIGATKLGYEVWSEYRDALRGPVEAYSGWYNEMQGDPFTNPPGDYEPWETRGRQPPSPGGQARQTVAIPREAPAPRPKSRARAKSRAPSTRGRSQTRRSPTPGDIQQGITGGSSSRLVREEQMGPNVKAAARAIIRGGLALRG